jgi:hypothetical protein
MRGASVAPKTKENEMAYVKCICGKRMKMKWRGQINSRPRYECKHCGNDTVCTSQCTEYNKMVQFFAYSKRLNTELLIEIDQRSAHFASVEIFTEKHHIATLAWKYREFDPALDLYLMQCLMPISLSSNEVIKLANRIVDAIENAEEKYVGVLNSIRINQSCLEEWYECMTMITRIIIDWGTDKSELDRHGVNVPVPSIEELVNMAISATDEGEWLHYVVKDAIKNDFPEDYDRMEKLLTFS